MYEIDNAPILYQSNDNFIIGFQKVSCYSNTLYNKVHNAQLG